MVKEKDPFMETILRMTLLDWGIFILAIGPYTPLIVGLLRQKDRSQTFLTWILYSALDSITMSSSLKEGPHGFAMAFGLAVGSLIMSFILLYQRRYARFSLVEIITITLIAACLFIWKFGSSHYALIASIASESIVGIYLIFRTTKDPVVEYNFSGYLGFLIVSIFTLLTAKHWELSTVGFAISETILNIVILIPLIKKRRRDEKPLIFR